MLADHRAGYRVDGKVPILVGLGVLTDPAAVAHDVIESDVADAIVRLPDCMGWTVAAAREHSADLPGGLKSPQVVKERKTAGR